MTFAGNTVGVGPLAAATHVWTQEHFDGPSDAFLVIVSGSASNAIAFDDDDGIGLQSWLHLAPSCSSCSIVFGRFNAGVEGPGAVAWDGDIHVADTDSDGLGDSYENVLTTTTTDRDTDDDGLDDAAEAIGIDGSPPVKLYTWGADPKAKDVFVELDCSPCSGAPCGGNADLFQMSGSSADLVASHFAPDVHTHLDIGRTNPATTKSDWTKWGAWGGALRTNWVNFCNALTPTRVGSFHHYHINGGGGSGGNTPGVGTCRQGGNNDRTMAHELGHNVGLMHGGNSGTGLVNNKPNYPSMINYGYQFNPGVDFSRNTMSAAPINPSSLNEVTSGLGASLLTTLASAPWSFVTDSANGKIDWNRDGRFDSIARGTPTWLLGSADPEPSSPWTEQDLEDGTGPAFARLSSPQRFYLFSRRSSDNKLQYRYTTSFASCAGGDGVGSCVSWVGPKLIDSSIGGSAVAPAAARFVTGGSEVLMLVYIDAGGTFWYQIGLSADVWTLPIPIDTTGTDIEPELVPAGPGGQLRLYYEFYGLVWHRDFDPATFTWSAAQYEKIPTGAPIAMSFGISVTSGFEVGTASPSWYAAIANPGNGNIIDLWRYNAAADNWTQLTGIWPFGQVATDAAPSLAFVPFSTSDGTTGQF